MAPGDNVAYIASLREKPEEGSMNILLAHGSSAASHAEQVQSLAETVSSLLGEAVGVSFIDDEKLPDGARVLPLFVGEGSHVRDDIPRLVASSCCTLLPPLAAHAGAIAGFAYDLVTQQSRRVNGLFALYRFGGFETLAAALHAQNKRCSQVALASMHSEPSLQAVLKHWREQAIDPVIIQPLLLFEGRTLDRLRRMADGYEIIMNPVISKHEGFPALIADCLKERI